MLAFPQADGSEFILDTDASAYAIGAVWSQVQDGRESVIAYGSRCLDKPEGNYCVTRREMLAVVYFTSSIIYSGVDFCCEHIMDLSHGFSISEIPMGKYIEGFSS
jgi:hypothetical protein